MRTITVIPGQQGSVALTDVPEPTAEDRLIIGHESLGRVVEAPQGTGFGPGDLVVGIVRHPKRRTVSGMTTVAARPAFSLEAHGGDVVGYQQ